MRFFSPRLMATVAVSVGLLGAVNPASAADGAIEPVKVKKHRVKVVKLKSDQDRFLHGSKETQTMRDSRLKRECHGAADGGACRGYTR